MSFPDYSRPIVGPQNEFLRPKPSSIQLTEPAVAVAVLVLLAVKRHGTLEQRRANALFQVLPGQFVHTRGGRQPFA